MMATSAPSTSCWGCSARAKDYAAKTLESLGISLDAVRQQVEEIVGRGQQAPSGAHPVHAAGQEGA